VTPNGDCRETHPDGAAGDSGGAVSMMTVAAPLQLRVFRPLP
jgi:hypothetical protein